MDNLLLVAAAAALRQEVTATVSALSGTLGAPVTAHGATQRQDLAAIRAQVEKLTESNEARIDAVRRTVDERLREIQEANARELQEMRVTVDEKLQGTLNQRLGESFALVTERLEQVHKGLGEMQTLASGVGDLKKVLSNVKVRGGWGEVQLETARNQMDSLATRTRVVTRKLRAVGELPEADAKLLLGFGTPSEADDDAWVDRDDRDAEARP